MKRNAFFLALTLTVLAVVISCTQPLDRNSSSAGDITFVLNSGRARTVQPSAPQITITSYSVSGSGPDGEVLSSRIFTDARHTVVDLVEGGWTFLVSGRNSSGTVVATGTASARISAGSTALVPVTLLPVSTDSSTGSFTLTASWPGSVSISQITGTITPEEGGAAQVFSAVINGSSADCTVAGLGAGSYYLTLSARTLSGSECRAIYALRIYSDMDSPLELTYTENDFPAVPEAPVLRINPTSVSEGQLNQEYVFTLTADNIPSDISEVTFMWNFGDGSSSATGSRSAVISGGRARIDISHTYIHASSYGLVASISDGISDLASAVASVVIGQALSREEELTELNTWKAAQSGGYGMTVDIWDISMLPDGVVFDINFNAYSFPDKYIVEYPVGTVVWDSGWRGDSSYQGNPLYPGGIAGSGAGQLDGFFMKDSVHSEFRVIVAGGEPGTVWDYEIRARD